MFAKFEPMTLTEEMWYGKKKFQETEKWTSKDSHLHVFRKHLKNLQEICKILALKSFCAKYSFTILMYID